MGRVCNGPSLLWAEMSSYRYHDTKGEFSFAKGFYHIRLKTAHPRLPSSEQVFQDLPPLQFAYSKRFLTTPKQEDGV